MAIVVGDVIAACASQKRGKAVGLDCINMEAFIHGEQGFMFTSVCYSIIMFLRYGYLPKSLI